MHFIQKIANAAIAVGLAASFMAPGQASAQDNSVVLFSSDETLRINGELVEFADGFYTVRTLLGDMRISASRVSCEGPDPIRLATVSCRFF